MEWPFLHFNLKAGEKTVHSPRLICDPQRTKDLLKDLLRYKVFVKGVTHVEVQFEFRLFENKGERPKKDAFEVFFFFC